MNKDIIKITGTLQFDVTDKTTKHKSQSSWKRVAIVVFNDDLCEYYSWFLKRRYDITLKKPLRGSHFTVVNDKYNNTKLWDSVKRRHQGDSVSVYFDIDMRTNIKHWWLKAKSPESDNIRRELMLGPPFFSQHITIGEANEKNLAKSKYALDVENFFYK